MGEFSARTQRNADKTRNGRAPVGALGAGDHGLRVDDPAGSDIQPEPGGLSVTGGIGRE